MKLIIKNELTASAININQITAMKDRATDPEKSKGKGNCYGINNMYRVRQGIFR